ncbi:ATP-binding protein [Undibacterium sp. TJN25]|uniref:hybrid sensor histidine kinase/response regulator n=1 Tax=Undibacterium sp. TJN25 TaxID=3413056 RepID=UPI003BF22BED
MDLNGPRLNYDRLYDKAACGLIVTDENGKIYRCNETFCGWVGLPASELVGKRRIQDLFTMGGKVFHQTHLMPLLQMQGSVAEVQIDIRHADRSVIPTLINIFRRKEGDTVFDELAIFIATDRRAYERELLLARRNAEASLLALAEAQKELQDNRDELRLANAELARADRRKDEFLATLAHELRNPLAPMRTVLEILKLTAINDPQLIKAREVLERQMQQIAHLVDDLMDVSRITQGRIELRRERIDIAEVMLRAREASQALIDASAHRLNVTWPKQLLPVDADPTRLTQILTNLLNNAAKYTPDGGSIWFEATREDGYVVVYVRDSGIGISADHLGHVFNMFSQLEPALSRSQGGLGIGLALVKGLVALHGGTIDVSSAGVGQGSEFVLRLPLATQAAGNFGQPSQGAGPGTGVLAPTEVMRRVLVIDDNRDGADMLEMALTMLGFSVAQHYDGPSALLAGPVFLPDVVILDIGLPGMDGYTVAREIRSQPWGEKILLIAATGWGQQRDKEAATAAGFDVHMVKPLDFTELEKVINKGRAQH